MKSLVCRTDEVWFCIDITLRSPEERERDHAILSIIEIIDEMNYGKIECICRIHSLNMHVFACR